MKQLNKERERRKIDLSWSNLF